MDTASADAEFAAWMRDNLDQAAKHFRLTISGEPVYGWRLKSISAPAVGPDGPRWLRVVSQERQWAAGEHWTGTADANAITGIRKPRVLDVHEWTEHDWRTQRAEVMTVVPGQVCSPTETLHKPIDLPEHWWTDLERSLATLRKIPTQRVNADQAKITERVQARFGDTVDTKVSQWETVHGDLHWNNLLGPDFALLDWELWGQGPDGTDAATLYLYSLLVPDVAARVHATFADQLDASTGRLAQLYVAARLFRRIDDGDFPDLADPLHQHIKRLLA